MAKKSSAAKKDQQKESRFEESAGETDGHTGHCGTGCASNSFLTAGR